MTDQARNGYVDSYGRWIVRDERELRAALQGDQRGRVITLGSDIIINNPIGLARAKTKLDGGKQRLIFSNSMTTAIHVQESDIEIYDIDVVFPFSGKTAIKTYSAASRFSIRNSKIDCPTAFDLSAGDELVDVWHDSGATWKRVTTQSGWELVEDSGGNQAIGAATWTAITNNGSGSNTDADLPVDVANIWDTSSGYFDLTNLRVGDVVDIEIGFTPQAAAGDVVVEFDHSSSRDVRMTLLDNGGKTEEIRARLTVPVVALETITPKVLLDNAINIQVTDFRAEVRRKGL